jgi:hypothetical protein
MTEKTVRHIYDTIPAGLVRHYTLLGSLLEHIEKDDAVCKDQVKDVLFDLAFYETSLYESFVLNCVDASPQSCKVAELALLGQLTDVLILKHKLVHARKLQGDITCTTT